MSDVQAPPKPEAAAAPAPAAPAKFNTDAFENCTARCTRQAWDCYLWLRRDQTAFETTVLRCRITAASDAAAQAIAALLKAEAQLNDVKIKANQLDFQGTLAQVMLVIKHADLRLFDAAKIKA